MFEWVNGPGKAFKNPAKGSTNYLSAYTKQGQLKSLNRNAGETIDVIPFEQEEAVQRREEAEGLDEAERAARFDAREVLRAKKRQMAGKRDSPNDRFSSSEPFPLNPNFKSQRVLSEELREEIYTQVVERGLDISTVSTAYEVDTRRVAAVVRLMTIEKKWIAEGKSLAKPYNKAVLSMLPKTPFSSGRITPHETINDLPVHPHTRTQLFVPTSESRHFTRVDAAKAFSPTLLPADDRIPHPELIVIEKEILAGVDRNERLKRQTERDRKAQAEKEAAEERQKRWREEKLRVVQGRRWDFKFEDISAEKTGPDGRGRDAVGIRYASPYTDRNKGEVKIPKSVE